jgi:hypothetical protein
MERLWETETVLRAAIRPAQVVALGLCLIGVGGCASSTQPREDETTLDLRHIARAYGVIQSAHSRPPKDLDEVRTVLAELHAGGLSGPPEEVLTSARDGQPYVVLLTVNLGASPGDEIFIYEASGRDGARYVMTTAFDVRQVSDAEFSQARFAGGHRPGS